MSAFHHFYRTPKYRNSQGNEGIDQLLQLLRIVWDGDLISKQDRDELVDRGFALRCNGFNIITKEGIEFLHKSKIIQS